MWMTAGEELTAHTIGRYFWYNGDYNKNIKMGMMHPFIAFGFDAELFHHRGLP